MSLSRFIREHMKAIVAEWQTFAMTMEPAATTMSPPALRDHAEQILLAVAADLDSVQGVAAQAEKSKGRGPLSARETAAATHGALRQVSGFNLNQLGAEYRALRASVIRLWMAQHEAGMTVADVVEDMIRFNEAVDQAVAESTARYVAELALSRDTFMAILAHDLRSPLSAIQMLGQLMGDKAANEAAKLQADQIVRSAREMGDMIRDLLEYTRTHLGKGIPVVPTDINIARVCAEALDEVRSGHPDRQFLLDVPSELPGHADGARLRQALSNLLNNALQHGDARSPITLAAQAEGEGIAIRVKNMGEPIPADSLQVIFDPLVQLPRPSGEDASESSTNLGLGLFIAREVALGHGGSVVATSSAQEGTEFTILLPSSAADQPAAAGR